MGSKLSILISLGPALAGGAYALLILHLLNSWRGRLPGGLFLTASALTTAWALAAALTIGSGTVESAITTLLDAARLLAWTLFLSVLIGFRPLRDPRNAVAMPTWCAIIAATFTAIVAVAWLLTGTPLILTGVGLVHHASLLVLSVCGLVLVEQLYRDTPENQRWGIKFLCLGLGGMFAYDFFLYAEALLQQQLEPGLAAARGVILALVVPLLAVSVSRNPDWSLKIFVSRRLVIHSVALMGSGIYLLIMAAGAYYLRFYGGNWGGVAQAIFLFGAAMLLLVILSSGKSRAGLKVFLSKHFFAYRYDYREEWRRLTDTLSSPRGQLKERAIRALAEIVESPAGALWLRHDNGMVLLASRWNLSDCNPDPVPIESSLLHFLEQRRWVVDLDAYRRDSTQYPDLSLPDWMLGRPDAWLLIPLHHGDRLLGFVLLTPARAHHSLNWEDFDLLKAAASQIAAHLAQAEAQESLLEARQFEAYNRFSTFVVHDLKNLIAQLSLLVSNAARHRNNPEFLDDAVETIEHSVARMQRLLAQLCTGGHPGQLQTTDIDLCTMVAEVVSGHAHQQPIAVLEPCAVRPTIRAERDHLQAVIGHVIDNAQQATPESGEVKVRVLRQGAYAVIEIQDNGQGMTNTFIETELFRPFASTRQGQGMGIGAYQCRTLIRSLGGEVEVVSTPTVGTLFRLLIPCSVKAIETDSVLAEAHAGRTIDEQD